MADFNQAVKLTLGWEGGYVNDPSDPGGETNFGIAKRNHPNVDIRNLTVDGAIQIYQAEYWNSLYEQIFSQTVANKLFDMGVNMGVGTAVKLLQRTLGVGQDGAFGPRTLLATNQEADALLAPYKSILAQHYQEIAARNPAEAKFLNGWLHRVSS